jgi:hypothetical protein
MEVMKCKYYHKDTFGKGPTKCSHDPKKIKFRNSNEIFFVCSHGIKISENNGFYSLTEQDDGTWSD